MLSGTTFTKFVRAFLHLCLSDGTTDHCRVQRQSRCSHSVKSAATWWGTVRPTALTTPCLCGKQHTHTHTNAHTFTVSFSNQHLYNLISHFSFLHRTVCEATSTTSPPYCILHTSPSVFPTLSPSPPLLPPLKIIAALIPLPILICRAQYCLSGQISPL